MPDYPTLEPTARTNTAALLRPCWLDGMAIKFMVVAIAAERNGFNAAGQRPARPRVGCRKGLRQAGTPPCTRLISGALLGRVPAFVPIADIDYPLQMALVSAAAPKKGLSVKMFDADVVDYLSGANTVRDSRLVGLKLAQGENDWDVVLVLTFDVPRGSDGDQYELALWGDLTFSYEFSSETMLDQVAFMKCLWSDEGAFYLSLDPWKENERFPSENDGSCFRSRSASLTISGKVR